MKRMRHVRMKSILLTLTAVCFVFYLTRLASFSSPQNAADVVEDRRQPDKVLESVDDPQPPHDEQYESDAEDADPELFKVSETELREDWSQSVKENHVSLDLRSDSDREDVSSSLKSISANSERAELVKQRLGRGNLSDPDAGGIGAKSVEYLIVEYTKVFFQPKFCSKTSEEIFNSKIESCPLKNCRYTCNKDKETISKANMLIFHLRDLEMEFGNDQYKSNYDAWLKGTQQLPFKSTAEKLANNADQLWLLWNDESTPINRNLNQVSNFFNWTMSFKTNSEVYEGSYGFLKSKHELNAAKVQKIKQEIFAKDFKTRRNAILSFVSNCNSKYRIKIALEISKYYPVYVFGKCNIVKDIPEDEAKRAYPYLNSMGPTVSAHSKNVDESFLRNDVDCQPGSECEEKRLRSFKYYLAFENRNCTDYITEKIWRSLSKSIIPIVLQPAKQSYLKYQIPSGSFIHLQDFNQNIKSLTTYLREMNKNFKLYYDHLKWTSAYTEAIWQAEYLEPHRMCQLCKLLNNYDKNIYYNNIVDFFNNQCSDPM